MKIRWLGHASFLIISQDGTRIITDPYKTGGDLTYGSINETAAIVTISHDHFDHNNVRSIRGNPQLLTQPEESDIMGITFRGIASLHDDVGGRERGKNVIFCFDIDQIHVCHLGDLGHQLTSVQINEIGTVDVLLVPVGGLYTINGKVASEICDRTQPRIVIPMHYRNARCHFPIATVEEFLEGKRNVRRLHVSEVEVNRETLPTSTEIVVLESAM